MERESRKKLAVLLSGRGTNFAHLVKHLHLKKYEIVCVCTNNPLAKGLEIAKEANIPYAIIEPKDFKSREEYDEALVHYIRKYQPDLTVLAGFMRILTSVFIQHLPAINLHPSLLPRHKGLDAICRSYEDEYLEGGVSVHHVSSELDGGALIVQKVLSKEGLTLEEYELQIHQLEKEALVEAIEIVCKV